jgi:hypothetical protein
MCYSGRCIFENWQGDCDGAAMRKEAAELGFKWLCDFTTEDIEYLRKRKLRNKKINIVFCELENK